MSKIALIMVDEYQGTCKVGQTFQPDSSLFFSFSTVINLSSSSANFQWNMAFKCQIGPTYGRNNILFKCRLVDSQYK